jgi:hypothetical protein
VGTREVCPGQKASIEARLVKVDARQHSIAKITLKEAGIVDPGAREFRIAKIASDGIPTPQLRFS